MGLKGSKRIMKRPRLSQYQLWREHLSWCLEKCLKGKALRPGKQVHAVLLTSGITNAPFLGSKLVGMYASCGGMRYSKFVLGKIQKPNVFALNWMVLASAFHGHCEDAIVYFRLMQELGRRGNIYTFSIVLKACVGLMDLRKGREVHGMVFKMGFHDGAIVGNALIDMYCKCGKIWYALNVFDKMAERDVASWTSMIAGYCNMGMIEQALSLFDSMKLGGLEPNDFTWNALIAAHARAGDKDGAFRLFARMIKAGLDPDLVTWNALISGFAQSNKTCEALEMFRLMLASEIQPNQVTLASVLPACGSAGSIRRGVEIHGYMYRMGLEMSVFVTCALIDMYSKCGSLRNAQTIFYKVPIKNVSAWNAMIGCYGKCGMVDSSIKLFEKMQEEGIQANELTVTSILSACSHCGMVEKGLEIFRSMKESYRVQPTEEHYACILDLLCRSGRMAEAFEFLRETPMVITESMLGAFFHGCKVHGRRDLAQMMVENIIRMELKRPGGLVTLSNIYAADGEWEEVENVRKVMQENEIYKKPGFSCLEKRNGILGTDEIKQENRVV